MYLEETNGIRVLAEPKFLPEESRPQEALYVFAYTITLTNHGTEPVQLLSRHWIITDGTGSVREVKGEGVIGKQPVLEPGASFQYSSFSPIATPTGNMRGSYEMKGLSSGGSFRARIPLFFLRDLRQFN
jgi:ApaG protein